MSLPRIAGLLVMSVALLFTTTADARGNVDWSEYIETQRPPTGASSSAVDTTPNESAASATKGKRSAKAKSAKKTKAKAKAKARRKAKSRRK